MAEKLRTPAEMPVNELDQTAMVPAAELPTAITYDMLIQRYGAAAGEMYDRISRAGGFGSFGADFQGGRPALDLSNLDDARRAQITQILEAK